MLYIKVTSIIMTGMVEEFRMVFIMVLLVSF